MERLRDQSPFSLRKGRLKVDFIGVYTYLLKDVEKIKPDNSQRCVLIVQEATDASCNMENSN